MAATGQCPYDGAMRLAELSLGWQTDFILHRLDARLGEHADCVAVCTDSNPSFYWGNCLVLPAAPADGDLAHWLARFHALVAAGRPGVRHVAIGIDAPSQGRVLPSWQAAGFNAEETTVLALQPGALRAPPRPARADWQLRQIDLGTESEALLDLQCLDSAPYEPAGYREFQRLQLLRHARLAQLGLGAWFGLWCDGTLVAQCGLMRDADRPGALGRFQHVSTHPAWRRRGLCSALVHGVSAWGFTRWQLAQAVLCADPHDVAIGIYRSLGYQPVGEVWQLQRNAPQDTATAIHTLAHTSANTPTHTSALPPATHR